MHKEENAMVEAQEISENLAKALYIGGIDPEKHTIYECVARFKAIGLRHLALYLENGGYLLLCSDPKMINRVSETIADMEDAETKALILMGA